MKRCFTSRRDSRLRIRVSAFVLAILLLAPDTVQAQDSAQRPYEINAILPLTGSGAFIGDGHAGSWKPVSGPTGTPL
jgi:hypothetical protein